MQDRKNPLKTAINSLAFFNAKQPDAIATFKFAQRTLAAHKNRKTPSPYAKPLRELLDRASEAINLNYARQKAILRKYSPNTSSSDSMVTIFKTGPNGFRALSEHENDVSREKELINAFAETLWKVEYQLAKSVGAGQLVNYLIGAFELELYNITTELTANYSENYQEFPSFFRLSAALLTLLNTYEIFNQIRLPSEQKAFIEASKQSLLEHNLPHVIAGVLLKTIGDDTQSAGSVLALLVAKRKVFNSMPGINNFDEFLTQLSQIELAPVKNAQTFVEDYEQYVAAPAPKCR